MAIRTNRNVNTNDIATMSGAITLNTSTSVKVADANPNRLYIMIHNNDSSQGVWIKLQAASVDNDVKGIFIDKKGAPPVMWESPTDNIYTGEISAIADNGSPVVYVTEY